MKGVHPVNAMRAVRHDVCHRLRELRDPRRILLSKWIETRVVSSPTPRAVVCCVRETISPECSACTLYPDQHIEALLCTTSSVEGTVERLCGRFNNLCCVSGSSIAYRAKTRPTYLAERQPSLRQTPFPSETLVCCSHRTNASQIIEVFRSCAYPVPKDTESFIARRPSIRETGQVETQRAERGTRHRRRRMSIYGRDECSKRFDMKHSSRCSTMRVSEAGSSRSQKPVK